MTHSAIRLEGGEYQESVGAKFENKEESSLESETSSQNVSDWDPEYSKLR